MAGLLISVRDAAEALAALHGGADWIDVKEPLRGSLGRADLDVLQEVGRAVDGRAPCSAALGELVGDDPHQALAELPADYGLAKVGLASCLDDPDWSSKWRDCFAAAAGRVRSVAVVYADWQSARSPAPPQLLRLAEQAASQYLLIDTYDKRRGNLFQCFGRRRLESYCRDVRSAGVGLVLAGSLDLASLPDALALEPDLIAVRGAACDGHRESTIERAKVRQLRAAIDARTKKQIATSSIQFP